MEERIELLIDSLNSKRVALLENYLVKLEEYSKTEAGAQPQGLQASEWAGLIVDLDRHITNLELELRRKKVIDSVKKEVVHA